MSEARNELQTVIATLGELHAVLERLRGEFVHGIKTPADYERATNLLDELTDGRELSKIEEKILVELEDEILAYQRHSEQFRESNAAFEATCTPVQLIKDLMETLGLTGSDLPEIGDKTAVSKVLSGDRPISHKMAYALAERFSMEPRAFVSAASGKAAPLETVRTKAKQTSAYYRTSNISRNLLPVKGADAGESKRVASKSRRHLGKAPTKG
ncbi:MULTISPECIES: XRE family transcriptional regulator [Pseudomonas]|uniref:helix-turn-helix domain-containing protein n=1 Tax=Pseudomonas TaxID=286 RepID=UPI000875F467|nr:MULTISPECIES: XRE family transcriptional regulator [Pseudomonas]ROL70934.1 XRE family transcriptional regulator [Pseudomonas protegens]SCZ55273.1 HTH-type transcriptional regulator / antitoxin HigA [Pseudomonas sp. NFPP17]SDA45050.1 HTH-type transcriptional regulator / antitoxin HigA [Pseudomonas sp. NFPP15]SEK27904.1 HTH-type transcriptional regulator / antitoxin HigA [Pseudomonas sp. NFPP18]SFA44833.1 HTH-type transcriptional regulator / antitoxin HigA [Pseudomonas sp. NFPP13]